MMKPRANSKIRFLLKKLLKEIEKQGLSLRQTDACYGVDICINNENKLQLYNVLGRWDLRCGKYEPIRLDCGGVDDGEIKTMEVAK